MSLRKFLKDRGLRKNWLKAWLYEWSIANWFLLFYSTPLKKKKLVLSGDPVRYGTVLLALEQIEKDQIPGALAECGVYTGTMSKYIHENLPDRTLYLFDSFAGFDRRDTDVQNDHRFQDTSEATVLKHIGDTKNLVVRKGFFPETAIGLEAERFSFVMIDFDKYESTLAALRFFFPRTSPGGIILVHDYCSPESNWACSRALNEFLADKTERPVLIPDACGTALFRKI